MIMDLKNGVFDLGGYPLTKNTTIDDIPEIRKYNVEVMSSERRPDFYTVVSLDSITYGGIEAIVSVVLKKNQKTPKIMIDPRPGPNALRAKYAEDRCFQRLERSKKWLQAAMQSIRPSEESDHHVYYTLSWGGIGAFCHEDREYGINGGWIKVKFNA